MDTQPTHEFPPFFRVHTTGRIQRYFEHDFVPPSTDPHTGVVSRDVVISPENNVSARIFLPKAATADTKLPLLIYIHGGAFSIESAFSSMYHSYAVSLASESGCIVVSIEFRLAPEHPVPACYEDCYAATKWVGSHARVGQGPDPWLNEYADFQRVYVAGDSAGANIAHNMVVRAKNNTESMADDEFGFKFAGLIMVHPFFGTDEPDELWEYICPDSAGVNDVRLNPAVDLDLLSKLGSERVLVCVAEKDLLRNRGWNYYQGMKRSDWKGTIEFFETPGENHVFYLFNPASDKAISLLKRIVGFMNPGAGSQVQE
ncbi:putative carboxylesterase 13 [Sesamum angolense]|uniref:Carboxylesterase 13 n=1 Tax=Sesamum angolense TaxID=2727404 RepID=A0AAE2BXQ8_9LAMI|nr:putative carboxylesterase 13 [Sesamum angolense]